MKFKVGSWAAIGIYCGFLLWDIFKLIIVEEVSLSLSTAAPRLIGYYLIVLIVVVWWGIGWREVAKDQWPYLKWVEWVIEKLRILPRWAKITLIALCLFLPPVLVFSNPFKLGQFGLPLRLLIVQGSTSDMRRRP